MPKELIIRLALLTMAAVAPVHTVRYSTIPMIALQLYTAAGVQQHPKLLISLDLSDMQLLHSAHWCAVILWKFGGVSGAPWTLKSAAPTRSTARSCWCVDLSWSTDAFDTGRLLLAVTEDHAACCTWDQMWHNHVWCVL